MEKAEQESRESSEEEEQVPAQALTCKYCGEGPFPTMSELGIHSRKCTARKEARKKAKMEEPPTPYKTEVDVNSILEDILSKHPDITSKVREEVMDWAKLKGGLQPMEVQALLQSMRGITSTTAGIIASKYSFAVNKAVLEGKLQLPLVLAPPQAPQAQVLQSQPQLLQQPTVTPPSTFQQYSPTPQAYAPPTPSWGYPPPTQDVRGIVREAVREEMRGKEPREAEVYVDVQEPVRDKDGNVIIGPDDKPIMKYMRVPASQASQLVSPREDMELKILEKWKAYKDIFGSKEELTVEKIREIVRQETPKPEAHTAEKPITLEDVEKASSDAAQTAVNKVLEAYEKEDKEEKRHREVISAIRDSSSAKTVEGYKEDSFRILGQGLSEAAKVVGERKPVEVIIREGGPLLLGGAPGKEVEAGAGEGLINRLRKRGWVVEQ